ncbi:MAG TPA: CinA family nicotinamide mononucleotide deamidase-related protein [Anaerolineaceae bacterium]
MPVAEIIAIGTELLLGEIQDTNTRYLARTLRDYGIDIFRTMTVGDNVHRIAQAIHEATERCQIIITTGGLGPTVDDPTRAAVAEAAGVSLEYHPELWEQILARFARYGRTATENNQRQAWIPSGAIPIPNPVGTAPGFICTINNTIVLSLPGVPREMEYLTQNVVIPELKQRFDLQSTIVARVLHTAGVPESQVDEWVGDLETRSNPTVGLLAHPAQIDIRLTAKARSVKEANDLLDQLEREVRERIGDAIFGVDDETLESIAYAKLIQHGMGVACLECGMGGALGQKFVQSGLPPGNFKMLPAPLPETELPLQLNHWLQQSGAKIGVAASLETTPEKLILALVFQSPEHTQSAIKYYGGTPGLGLLWAVNTSLDFFRRID